MGDVENLLRIAAEVGLLYGPFVLAIYLSFVVLSIPDLSVEGSFGLGAGLAASVLSGGAHPLVAIAAAMGVGCIVGLVASLLHSFGRINALLVGILVATACWSVNLRIMGRANVSLLRSDTLYSLIGDLGLSRQAAALLIAVAATGVTAALLVWFLGTPVGLSIRATGRSIQTARILGIATERRQMLGLALANGLAATSGSLVAQSSGFADVQSQLGVVVIGIAALMIGGSIIRGSSILAGVAAAVVGIFVYRLAVAWALRLGLPANDIRLITAAIVVGALSLRSHGRGLVAGVGPRGRARRRRDRADYLEADRVLPIL